MTDVASDRKCATGKHHIDGHLNKEDNVQSSPRHHIMHQKPVSLK